MRHEGVSLQSLDREHRLALILNNNFVGERDFVRNVLFLEFLKVQVLTIELFFFVPFVISLYSKIVL